ncbi:hypothetical protein GCM10007301_05260 [Azorhizobium oxalatiphilum]|uniref:Uncharacterized protein n=1 Tax=Azorhizobium oxalatiphilum TaxID=980631 RepID=A0A917BLS3_9HYPH|nr:hypothetical protein GCM10007301_05260 [Azorhizobium oxalatiphilum]
MWGWRWEWRWGWGWGCGLESEGLEREAWNVRDAKPSPACGGGLGGGAATGGVSLALRLTHPVGISDMARPCPLPSPPPQRERGHAAL